MGDVSFKFHWLEEGHGNMFKRGNFIITWSEYFNFYLILNEPDPELH